MAGSINLSLTQQFDKDTGGLLSGGKLYFYAANTSTPQSAFKNVALTLEYPNPVTLESDGRCPMLYFDDGYIRVRMTNSAGILQFDEPNLLVVGPSSGSASEDSTDPDSVSSTGDVKWRPSSGTLSGWVRMNGRTIGSATSGANERANADAQSLYEFLWNNFSNTLCPVSGGRGGSGTADFSANKTMTLLDMRGKSPFGLDTMGNTAASAFTGVTFAAGNSSTGGSNGGVTAQTITQANLPAVTLNTTIASGQGSHTHALSQNVLVTASQGSAGGGNLLGSSSAVTATAATLPQMSGTTPLGGSGTVLETISPFMLGTWYIRL